jgi:isocitrate dehydrogenase
MNHQHKIPIALAHGDGIGPEITQAVLTILEATKAPLEFRSVEIGEKVYLKGIANGIEPDTWKTIRECKAFLKAPITTPQGGGFKSLNVTIRTTLGLFANVRPCVAYSPFVETKHPGMDVVIIRENEEDLYTGIEYRQTNDTFHALKIISRPGCERIVRYAFEYAKANGRKKVTCFTKDNIMKLSDGLFHKVFDEIALEYPNIENEHWIVDIGAAKLADTPTAFDVVVMPNLYGDILSDVAAQIAGSVGLAGSANIGSQGAMFEAIHGSAPRRAGQNLANPSGFLLASVLMLAHVGLPDIATTVHNAWLKTIEDGIHTYDIFHEGVSKTKVGTKEFAEAVVKRLGQKPSILQTAHYGTIKHTLPHSEALIPSHQVKKLVGIDLFIASTASVAALQKSLAAASHPKFDLIMISNRGVRVWPDLAPETLCIDSFRVRYMAGEDHQVTHVEIAELLKGLADQNIDFVKTEQLYTFDDKPGFS